MDWTLIHDDFEKYNNTKTAISKVKMSTWHNTPSVVLLDVYEYDTSGSLCEQPIVTCLNLPKLSNLNEHFKDSDCARQVSAIVLMEHFDNNLPTPRPLTFDKFVKTYLKYGIVLTKADVLFYKLGQKYDRFSPSWFDSYESS